MTEALRFWKACLEEVAEAAMMETGIRCTAKASITPPWRVGEPGPHWVVDWFSPEQATLPLDMLRTIPLCGAFDGLVRDGYFTWLHAHPGKWYDPGTAH